MVEEGKIDAVKAAELIDAISNKKEEEAAAPKAQSEKMLKIRVLSGAGEKVNIKLPIKFIKTGLKAFGKIPINIDGDEEQRIDVQAIAHAIENDIEGKIVDCCTSKGDNVEIVIE
jgi:phosphotransferase system HPr-like phosphotransfer protein